MARSQISSNNYQIFHQISFVFFSCYYIYFHYSTQCIIIVENSSLPNNNNKININSNREDEFSTQLAHEWDDSSIPQDKEGCFNCRGMGAIVSFSVIKKKKKKSSIFLHIDHSNRYEKMREMFLKVIARGQGVVTTGRNDPRKIGS